MPSSSPRHRGAVSRRRRVTRRATALICAVAVVLTTVLVVAYKQLEGNITGIAIGSKLGNRPDEVGVGGPQRPLNVLVMGDDSREGDNDFIEGETAGLSDTVILLHISGDRKRAYGVSLPRDAMVERPECADPDGQGTVPGGLTQFNAAYTVGGPLCTLKTVEQLTDIRIQHFAVINFSGFVKMVDAINGVRICVPEDVDDGRGIRLPEGTYTVKGKQALDYVRVRYRIGDGSDTARIARQQAFIAAMIKKVVSAGTLANPPRLYRFLDAATESLTTDEGLADLRQLGSIGSSLKNVGLDHVQFVTVPFEPYAEDSGRLQWSPDADDLWRRIRNDRPLGPFARAATSADDSVRGKPTQSPSAGESPDESPSGEPSDEPSDGASAGAEPEETPAPSAAEIAEQRERLGLCG